MCCSCAPSFNFLKKIAFLALFWPKFLLSRCKTLEFCSQDLSLFNENRSLDPTFGNPCSTYPKKLSTPLPWGMYGHSQTKSPHLHKILHAPHTHTHTHLNHHTNLHIYLCEYAAISDIWFDKSMS